LFSVFELIVLVQEVYTEAFFVPEIASARNSIYISIPVTISYYSATLIQCTSLLNWLH